MKIAFRATLIFLVAVLTLGASAAGGATDQVLVVLAPPCCAGGAFTVQTLDGTAVGSVPIPATAEPLTFEPSADGSVVYNDWSESDTADGGGGPVWLVGPQQAPFELDSSPEDFDASISPDGSTVVFARHEPATGASDIFVVKSDGTGLMLVASGDQTNYLSLPRFSPGGGSIAYDCTLAQLASPNASLGCGPLPDGSYRTTGVMLMNADGSDKRMVIAGEVGEVGSMDNLSWSPDGQWLTWTGCGPTGADPQACVSQIFAYRTDGSDLLHELSTDNQVTHFPTEQSAWHAEFSSDGAQMLFMRGFDDSGDQGNYFYSVARDGTNEHELFAVPTQYPEVVPPAAGGEPSPTVNATLPTTSDPGQVVFPSWIQQCRGFIVQTFARAATSCVPIPAGTDAIEYAAAANGSIVFSDANHVFAGGGDGGPVWLVGSGKAPVELDSSPYNENPSLSWDGSKVVFDRFDPADGSSDIYVVNANGSGLTLVADGNGAGRLLSPKFSPDGGSIAYSAPSGVMLMNADGSDKRMIVEGQTDSLSWSADGQWLTTVSCVPIVTAEGQTCVNQVFAYRTDGGDLYDRFDPSRQVTHLSDPWGPIDPQFTSDGTKILYLAFVDDSGTQGNFAYMVDRDGSNRHEVFLTDDPLTCAGESCSGSSPLGVTVPPASGNGPPPTVSPTHATVPDVRRLGYRAAEHRLGAVRLKGKVTHRRYSARIRRGHVIAQYPRARTHARLTKKHRTVVKLILSRGRAPKVRR